MKLMNIGQRTTDFALNAGETLDFLGILVILGGFTVSTLMLAYRFFQGSHSGTLYRVYRGTLARSILLGLEFLVAGDIIRTVAGELDFSAVAVLSIVVLIRTILGLEFQVELDGRWPWKRAASKKK